MIQELAQYGELPVAGGDYTGIDYGVENPNVNKQMFLSLIVILSMTVLKGGGVILLLCSSSVLSMQKQLTEVGFLTVQKIGITKEFKLLWINGVFQQKMQLHI